MLTADRKVPSHRPRAGLPSPSMSTDDTAASEHGADAETTEVPPPPDDEPGLAWSVDDDTDEMPTNRHGRLVWAGLAVLVVAITAALLLLVSTLFGRHTTNNARPQPVPSPPVTTAVAAAPPPAPVALPPPAPSVASASPYASLEGSWQGHHRWLTVSADGTVEMHIIDSAACPQCAAVDAPRATVHIGLTSYNGDNTDNKGRFGGYVKDSSDTRVVPAGVPVEVDVEPAGAYGARIGYQGSVPGRVMTISIKGMPVSDGWNFEPMGDKSPFCDEAALGTVCGA